MSTENGDDDLPPEMREHIAAHQALPDEPPEPAIEVGEGRQNAASVITDIALHRYQFYVNQFSDTLVDIKIGAVRKTMTVGSLEFSNHLRRLYRMSTGTVVSNDMLKNACMQIIAETDEVDRIKSALRIHRYGNEIFIDLCNSKWQAIKVSKKGWEIVDEVEGFRFLRTKDMRELPMPQPDGDIHDFKKILNLEDEQALLIVVLWILSTLTNGPYPILSINGPDGAAKSTATVIIGDVLDPINHPKRGAPKDIDALLAAAHSCHIQRFDNMSRLPEETSDTLCGMSTGITVTKRKLYTDNESVSINIQQPLIMNGIPNILTRRDLASRALPLRLRAIDDADRKTERSLRDDFDELWPSLLGAILKIAVYGLNNEEKYKGRRLKRMADSTEWWLACSDLLGGPDEIERIFDEADETTSAGVLENSHAAALICAFLRNVDAGRTSYQIKDELGIPMLRIQMKELYEEIMAVDALVENRGQYQKAPGNSRGLSVELDRLETAMGRVGLHIKTIKPKGKSTVLFKLDAVIYGEDGEAKANWRDYAINQRH